MPKKHLQTILGHRIDVPRITHKGWLMIASAIILVLSLMDAVLYLLFTYGLDRCYGIWCLI